jgi:hypothetical protein
MKSAAPVRTIANSTLLSYIYFNPIFQASRLVRKKLRRRFSSSSRLSRLKTA